MSLTRFMATHNRAAKALARELSFEVFLPPFCWMFFLKVENGLTCNQALFCSEKKSLIAG